jgi:hypothetical protein
MGQPICDFHRRAIRNHRPVVKGLFEAAVNVSGAIMSSAC